MASGWLRVLCTASVWTCCWQLGLARQFNQPVWTRLRAHLALRAAADTDEDGSVAPPEAAAAFHHTAAAGWSGDDHGDDGSIDLGELTEQLRAATEQLQRGMTPPRNGLTGWRLDGSDWLGVVMVGAVLVLLVRIGL